MKSESGRAPIKSGMGIFQAMKSESGRVRIESESGRAPIKSGMGTF